RVGRDARVRARAGTRLDLRRQREPKALRSAALDLAVDGLRVERLAHVLGRPDPADAGQAELDVDLDDDPHRRAHVGDVDAVALHLARLGVERSGARVVVGALDVDGRAARLELGERVATGQAHRARGHPGQARG